MHMWVKMVTVGRILNHFIIPYSANCKEETGCQLCIVSMGVCGRISK